MNLIQLQYFCSVARCRNMSRAADELCLSQSALSKAISNIEDELGFSLFDRVGRGIRLNESGRIYYHQVSHALLLLDDAARHARLAQRQNSHDVSVLLTAGTFLAPRLQEEFYELHPEISLEVKCSYSPDPNDLKDCDFHIFATPMGSSGLTCIKLIDEKMLIACSKKHPLAELETIDLADTQKYLYQCLPPQENMHENLRSGCQKAGFKPKIGFCTEDSYAFFSALGSSLYLTMIPSKTAFTAVGGNLLKKKISNPKCVRTLYISYHPNAELSSQSLVFRDFCIEFFKKVDAESVQ